MYNFNHLKTPKNTGSGVAQVLLVAPLEWFRKVAEPTGAGVAVGDEVLIQDMHLFEKGKGFFELLLAPETNSLEAKTIGDKGFQKLEQVLKVFVPGSYLEVHECMKNLLNVPFIALIRDSDCSSDFYYQLGTDCVPAYFSVNFATGTTKDGRKGYEVELSFTNAYVQLYKGIVKRTGEIFKVMLGIEGLMEDMDYILGLTDDELLGFDYE